MQGLNLLLRLLYVFPSVIENMTLCSWLMLIALLPQVVPLDNVPHSKIGASSDDHSHASSSASKSTTWTFHKVGDATGMHVLLPRAVFQL